MKRAHQLQPLSRQHHLGLNISRHAKECSNETSDINEHWHKLTSYLNSISTHFQIEDNLIAGALQSYRNSVPEVATALDTLNEQHASLDTIIHDAQTSKDKEVTALQVRELGTLLYNHIRFEERVLLPLVETYLTEDTLDAIYDASPDSIKRLEENR